MIDTKSLLKDVLKKYSCIYIAVLIISLINIGIFFLYQLPVEPFIYALILNTFAVLCIFILLIHKEKSRAIRLRRIKERSFEEWCDLPSTTSLLEADYQDMIRFLSKKTAAVIDESIKKGVEADDYYTNWVHQVKTPIAVMKLLLGNEDGSPYKELKAELFRIEQYVDMALLYIRLDSDQNDLLIKEYSIDELIKEVIRKHASSFIVKKLKLIYNGTDRMIVTDKKWFICILDQFISNAIKYTREGSIEICVFENSIHIKDTGPGIAKEDLPRIFEKGYTGINGRADKKSSGLGLYLAQKAAYKINLKISASSNEGSGSDFIIEC